MRGHCYHGRSLPSLANLGYRGRPPLLQAASAARGGARWRRDADAHLPWTPLHKLWGFRMETAVRRFKRARAVPVLVSQAALEAAPSR